MKRKITQKRCKKKHQKTRKRYTNKKKTHKKKSYTGGGSNKLHFLKKFSINDKVYIVKISYDIYKIGLPEIKLHNSIKLIISVDRYLTDNLHRGGAPHMPAEYVDNNRELCSRLTNIICRNRSPCKETSICYDDSYFFSSKRKINSGNFSFADALNKKIRFHFYHNEIDVYNKLSIPIFFINMGGSLIRISKMKIYCKPQINPKPTPYTGPSEILERLLDDLRLHDIEKLFELITKISLLGLDTKLISEQQVLYNDPEYSSMFKKGFLRMAGYEKEDEKYSGGYGEVSKWKLKTNKKNMPDKTLTLKGLHLRKIYGETDETKKCKKMTEIIDELYTEIISLRELNSSENVVKLYKVFIQPQNENFINALMNNISLTNYEGFTLPKIIMEDAGIPLIKFINYKITEEERGLYLNQKKNISKGIANGLKYMNDKLFFHQDIKPDNICLKLENGMYIPKIIDLGLVRHMSNNSQAFETQQDGGTPSYFFHGKLFYCDLWAYLLVICEIYGYNLPRIKAGGFSVNHLIKVFPLIGGWIKTYRGETDEQLLLSKIYRIYSELNLFGSDGKTYDISRKSENFLAGESEKVKDLRTWDNIINVFS